MSEYEYVMFQAADAPLTDKQLAFAERQSSRAEVSPWSFQAEYDYSSFRGDVDGMLRRGYDVFLRYTNYGVREIRIRLPDGLPVKKSVWSPYIDRESVSWKKDGKGSAGILSLHPFHESDTLSAVWDFGEHIKAAAFLRERLMTGDLRPLYVFWFCGANADDIDPNEVSEPPVPHGIQEMAEQAADFIEFYGEDPLLLVAAGEDVPPLPPSKPQESNLSQWLASQDEQRARELLGELLDGDTLRVKADLLAEIRSIKRAVTWPTTKTSRCLDDLLERTRELRAIEEAKEARKAEAKRKREAQQAERQRQQRMKEMAKSPRKWLEQADQLVEARGTARYKAAADILADLGEAVGGDKGERMVRLHAAHLAQQHPTLTHLRSSLRKRGLIP